jgi:hypothetical protein
MCSYGQCLMMPGQFFYGRHKDSFHGLRMGYKKFVRESFAIIMFWRELPLISSGIFIHKCYLEAFKIFLETLPPIKASKQTIKSTDEKAKRKENLIKDMNKLIRD